MVPRPDLPDRGAAADDAAAASGQPPPPVPLAVIGSSILLPGGITTPEKFFAVIASKTQVQIDILETGRFDRSDVDEQADHPWKLKSRWGTAFSKEGFCDYDTHFFNITSKLARNIQAHQLAALQSAYEALEDAGISLQEIHRTRTGIFAAAYSPFLPAPLAPDETYLRGNIMSTIADQVGYFLGTHGPSVTLEVACGSSIVALALAANSLQAGDCDYALVLGINFFDQKDFHLALQACGVLVQGPTCHPFCDDGAKGFLRAEGMGCVVLRRLPDAEASGHPVHCLIRKAVAASAGAADTAVEGPGRVYEQPCPFGMRQMFLSAYQSVGLPLKRLSYMECHATGTAVGDIIEVEAIGDVFGDSHDKEQNPLRIASVKSNIGHAEVAAGMFSLIKVMQMMKRRVFLPTAGVTTPLKAFDWEGHNMRVQQELEPFPPESEPGVVIGINSFGIGGSYAHCIVEEYRGPKAKPASSTTATATAATRLLRLKAAEENSNGSGEEGKGELMLPLSAFSMAHLQLYAERLAAFLKEQGEAGDGVALLRDLCGTMSCHRSLFMFRRAFHAAAPLELAAQLEAFAAAGEQVKPAGEGRKMQVCYVFTGQGSQFPGVGQSLLRFPVYREAVAAVDKQFKALAGWSILDKLATLPAAELKETMYAQPASFLVQVGLFELLKSFGVFPDVVLGHSAGEVPAAYAAGLLTLEEAVEVVYHRSTEQQKMAGCGRLLVVGMAADKARALLEAHGYAGDVEVACVNSVESTVLAGDEARLLELKQSVVPSSVATTFVEGNIAFHSSRMEPILPAMRARLTAVLGGAGAGNSQWSLPFVSTVSGRVEARVDADYWCRNVREPVLFHKAIDGIFAAETVPDVVLEIGPHQTLVSPIKQILNGSGKAAAVLPSLKKGAPCSRRFFEALGKLFELGVQVDLKPYYRQRGYAFLDAMPKHPFVKHSIFETVFTRLFDVRNGQYTSGPVAGFKRLFDGSFLTEVSDRTYAVMCEHVMGGKHILPGSFFLEMALEAAGGLPVTLTNVEYKAMARIPQVAQGDVPAYCWLTTHEEDDGGEALRFAVRSCPGREKFREAPPEMEHCSGRIHPESRQMLLETVEGGEGSTAQAVTRVRPGLRHEAFGHLAPLELADLGKEGLRALVAAHTEERFGSKDKFYGSYCQEGIMEYGPSFQLIESVHFDPTAKTAISKVSYPHRERWAQMGGVYAPEFLDAVTQMTLILVTDSTVYYAGGFESAHFLRQPTTDDIYVHLLAEFNPLVIGRTQKSGDIIAYDGNGLLLFYIQGFFSIRGATADHYRICDLKWQGFGVTSAAAAPLALPSEEATAAVTARVEWTPEDNARLTAQMVRALEASGALVDDGEEEQGGVSPHKGPKQEAEASLAKTLREGIAAHTKSPTTTIDAAADGEGGKLPPALGHLAEEFSSGDALAAALAAKVRGQGEGPQQQEVGADALRDAVAAATFQRAEVMAVAERLRALAVAEAAKVRAAPDSPPQGATGYVLRVLELAEDKVDTVLEALSHLELPPTIIIEVFLASSSATLLPKLGTKLNRRHGGNRQLRVRRVLFSEALQVETKDLAFHALVLDDWARTGAAAWAAEEEEGINTNGTAHRRAPSQRAMDFLARFLVPGAAVFARGFADLPLWARLASQLSPTPLPLPPSAEAAAAARAEWQRTLAGYNEKGEEEAPEVVAVNAAATVVVGQYARAAWARAFKPGRFIVVAPSAEEGRSFQASLAALSPDSAADVLVAVAEAGASASDTDVGAQRLLTDASTCEDYEQLIKQLLKPLAGAAGGSGGEDGSGSRSRREAFRGFVFLAGVHDEGIMGEAAFGRLLKFCQAIYKCTDNIKALLRSKFDPAPPLWLVTRGVFMGQIVPAQGTMQGFQGVLANEMYEVFAKTVDLGSLDAPDMQALAELVLADPPERQYGVEAGVVRVPRFHALDTTAARAQLVAADSKEFTFYADMDKLPTPGKIGVFFRLQPSEPPKDDEVTIEIHAAALNFRDVMIALSLLPLKSYEGSFYGKALGLEAAGVVSAVGKDVTDFKVGDRVLCGEPRCFANRLNAPARRVCPLKDDSISFEDAASIQSVYNTSHHALVNLARLRKGEKVLIHSAAGGIGHAAISIAKHIGAEIYATAGSEEKRQLVRDMGVERVYNSRSTEWFEELMRDTDNKGVNVVLNSLAGKHQRLGLQALCSSGRFCEIGKVDIFADNKLGLLAFRRNISFFAIDMDRLWLDDPELSAEVAREVGKHFEAGHYHKLPIKVFPMSEIRGALEFMKTGKHVGKVVLTNYEAINTDATAAAATASGSETAAIMEPRRRPLAVKVEKPQRTFRPDGTYLITGGGGGFGSTLLRHAHYEHGATSFLITTRSANHDKIRSSLADMLSNPAVRLEIVTADTGKEEDVKRVCARAREMDPPVRHIFHAAGVSVDMMLHEVTEQTFRDVGDCKCKAAWWLHENTLDMPIETFVTTSSIAALVGGLGMTAYSAANAYLDALVRYRRQLGLPAATFNMTSLSDVGILANNIKARRFHMKVGMEFISAKTALGQLETGLTVGMQQVTTLFFKPKTMTLFPQQSPYSHNLQDAWIMGMDSNKKQQMTAKEIAEYIAEEIRSITGCADVLVTSGLTTLGLDSLGFVELGTRLKKTFGIELDALKLTQDMTVADIAKLVYKLQARTTTAGGGGSGDGAGADEDGENSLDASVFHTAAEKNSMLATPFASSGPPRPRLRQRGSGILLYGADGARGAHILKYLLKGSSTRRPRVHCLGAWATAENGAARIERAMREAGLWKPQYAARIVPVANAQVTQAGFRLPADAYERLVAQVGAVVHAGTPLLWSLDGPLVAENVSALMNLVAFARRNGADVHYVSSPWLDGYDATAPDSEERRLLHALPEVQVKKRAEDLLHYAAHHHGLRCAAHRLPFLAPNKRGRLGKGHTREGCFVARTMAILRDSGLLVQEAAGDIIPLIPADAAGAFVARHVLALRWGVAGNGGGGNGRAIVRSPVRETECVSMGTLADWVEAATPRVIDRDATPEDMVAYFEKRLKLPPVVESFSKLFNEVMPTLSGVTRRLVVQAHRDVTPMQLLLLRAKRRMMTVRGADRLPAPEALRRYLLDDPTLFASALGDDDEEPEAAPEASSGTGSSDGGSSASESGDDERVSPDSPVKAKAAGASPANGSVVSVVSQ